MYIYPLFKHLLSITDYWDSFWIIEGLIQSQLFDIAKDTLENFMDEIEKFGFIPNGGRIYCITSSYCLIPSILTQYSSRPEPLATSLVYLGPSIWHSFILANGRTRNQMLSTYVSASNDISILDRALPLAEARSHFSTLRRPTNIQIIMVRLN